jgi:hypothetical protein
MRDRTDRRLQVVVESRGAALIMVRWFYGFSTLLSSNPYAKPACLYSKVMDDNRPAC